MDDYPNYDVLIIGGSYAGLSAAMALGRSMRKVLIIDSGKPCNWQTPHSHNFIPNDGKTPAAISKEAKHQVLQYPTITFINDLATQAKKIEFGFQVTTESGKNFTARKLILATGVKDVLPDYAGFSDCWGISVLHCPYCHGYEVRGKEIGIIADGPMGYELSKLISNWTDKLTVFTSGITIFDDEHLVKLEQHNIKLDERQIDFLHHDKGYITKIQFKDGTFHKLDALFARPQCEQNSEIAKMLGCDFTEEGLVAVDSLRKTSVVGVFAVGDCTTLFRSIAGAVASGNKAGAIANKEMIDEDF